jgi:hypothetical protein
MLPDSSRLTFLFLRGEIDARMKQVGQEYRGDWILTEGGRLSPAPDRCGSAGGPLTEEYVIFARARLRQARRALGHGLTPILEDVVLKDMSAGQAAERQGLRAKSGIDLLRAALNVIARVYQPGDPYLRALPNAPVDRVSLTC